MRIHLGVGTHGRLNIVVTGASLDFESSIAVDFVVGVGSEVRAGSGVAIRTEVDA